MTNHQNNQAMNSVVAGYSASMRLIPLVIFYGLYWPLAALLGDRPSRVARNEPTLVHIGCWISVLLHSTIALLLVGNSRQWIGLAWLLFSGLLIARRIAAGVGHPLPMRELVDRFKGLGKEPRYVYGFSALIVATAPVSGRIGFLDGLSGLTTFAAACAMLIVPVLVARTIPAEHRANEALHAEFDGMIATAFGLTAQNVYLEVGLECDADGLWLSPIPAALAAKLIDPAKVEAQLAAIAPDFTLDMDNSGPERIHLAWATDEIREARSMAAATDGLIVGVDGLDQGTGVGDEITFTLEDLE